jgi:hypothetical protein
MHHLLFRPFKLLIFFRFFIIYLHLFTQYCDLRVLLMFFVIESILIIDEFCLYC